MSSKLCLWVHTNRVAVVRDVHGLGQVGFVPNPDPTRIIWEEENMVGNWLGWFGWIFRFGSCEFRVVSVRVSGLSPGTIFGRIWPRFRWITTRSCRIWSGMLDILPETLKVSDIWSGMLNISLEMLKVLVRVGLHGFWNVKPTTGSLGSGLTVRNSRSTTGVVGSGGSGSDLGGLARLSGSVGLLDSPSHCILENDRLSHMHPVEAKSFLKDNEFSSVPWQ